MATPPRTKPLPPIPPARSMTTRPLPPLPSCANSPTPPFYVSQAEVTPPPYNYPTLVFPVSDVPPSSDGCGQAERPIPRLCDDESPPLTAVKKEDHFDPVVSPVENARAEERSASPPSTLWPPPRPPQPPQQMISQVLTLDHEDEEVECPTQRPQSTQPRQPAQLTEERRNKNSGQARHWSLQIAEWMYQKHPTRLTTASTTESSPRGPPCHPTGPTALLCAECHRPITVYFVPFEDRLFHPECFLCDGCHVRLSTTFEAHGHIKLCKGCFHRFRTRGRL